MGILASANLLGTSGSAPLPGFLNSLQGPLDHYGYGAIALLLLLENIGIPVVPGELALIAGAIFAGTGRAGLNVVLVGVVAVIVVIVGAEIGYVIGKFAGRELILRYGKYVLLTPQHLKRAEAIVSRYGGFVVIIARFIVGLREANGLIAGISQMRWFTFLVFNVIGACAWVATWLTLGYVAGDHIGTIYADINRYLLYVLIGLVVLFAGYIVWRRLRRRGSHGAEEVAEAEETVKANGTAETEEVLEADERISASETTEAGRTVEAARTDESRATGTDESRATGTDESRATGTDESRAAGTDESRAAGTDESGAAGTDESRAAGTDESRAAGTDESGAAGTDESGAAGTDKASGVTEAQEAAEGRAGSVTSEDQAKSS
jgi:membrane protein DedA with SNARE-associated domain